MTECCYNIACFNRSAITFNGFKEAYLVFVFTLVSLWNDFCLEESFYRNQGLNLEVHPSENSWRLSKAYCRYGLEERRLPETECRSGSMLGPLPRGPWIETSLC